MRDHPPRTAGAQDVQNAVDHLPQIHGPGPSSRLGWRKQRKQNIPLFAAQVGGILLAIHPDSLRQLSILWKHPLRDVDKLMTNNDKQLIAEELPLARVSLDSLHE